MEYTKLGKTDIEVSKITFGCWAIGAGKEWGKSLEDQEYQQTIMTAYEEGINFFDTATGYGGGHSEELLGKTIHDFRDQVVISSKCAGTGLIKEKAESNVDLSLKRLNTDYIDLYFVHWPNPDVDIRENVEALMSLKEKGKIKAIGLSNMTVEHIKRAQEVGDIDMLQPCYSLYFRQIEKEILPYCIDNSIGVMSYSSIASGLLSGKFTKDWVFDDTDMRKNKIALFKKDVFEKAIDINEKLMPFTEKYNRSLAQIAINWVIKKRGITTAIVGAKKASQVKENIKATDFILSDEDFNTIGELTMEVADMVSDWDTMYLKDDHRLVIK